MIQANELIERVNALVGGTGDQMVSLAQTAKRNRRMIWVLWVGFVLDIALTVAMSFGFVTLHSVASRVDETQRLTQTQVLCPLYQQFINSDTPAARALAAENGQDMTRRAEAFRVIRQSYAVLNCE